MADAVATKRRRYFRYFHHHHLCRKCIRCNRGGRTGLTAITTGLLFLLALIFSPLFLTIPSFATAPALIIVGFYMMGAVVKINFEDMSEAIPSFLCIIAMPPGIQHFRRYRHRRYFLDTAEPADRKSKGQERSAS